MDSNIGDHSIQLEAILVLAVLSFSTTFYAVQGLAKVMFGSYDGIPSVIIEIKAAEHQASKYHLTHQDTRIFQLCTTNGFFLLLFPLQFILSEPMSMKDGAVLLFDFYGSFDFTAQLFLSMCLTTF